jgi:hypothetical protein
MIAIGLSLAEITLKYLPDGLKLKMAIIYGTLGL